MISDYLGTKILDDVMQKSPSSSGYLICYPIWVLNNSQAHIMREKSRNVNKYSKSNSFKNKPDLMVL